MKKLLVIGGSIYQKHFIEVAKKYGIYTYAISWDKNDPAIAIADEGYEIDIFDLKSIINLINTNHIDSAYTVGSDLATDTVAKLNEHYNWEGLTQFQVENVSHKSLFVELQKEINIPTPIFINVKSVNDVNNDLFWNKCNKAILKPCQSSGSKGIKVVTSKEEAIEFITAQFLLKTRDYILEEFIEGKEVGCDAFVKDGKVIFLELTNKFLNNLNVPIGHLVPNIEFQEQKQPILEQVQKIVDYLGVKTTSINLDAIISNDGTPYLIDFSFRSGGNCIPDIMKAYYGFDVYLENLKFIFPDLVTRPEPTIVNSGFVGSIILGVKNETVITDSVQNSIKQFFNIPDLLDIKFDFHNDKPLTILPYTQSSNRFGQVIVNSKTFEDFNNIIEKYWKLY